MPPTASPQQKPSQRLRPRARIRGRTQTTAMNWIKRGTSSNGHGVLSVLSVLFCLRFASFTAALAVECCRPVKKHRHKDAQKDVERICALRARRSMVQNLAAALVSCGLLALAISRRFSFK